MRNGFLNNINKTLLYLSSFFPLFILLLIQNIKIRDDRGALLMRKLFFTSLFQKLSLHRAFFG